MMQTYMFMFPATLMLVFFLIVISFSVTWRMALSAVIITAAVIAPSVAGWQPLKQLVADLFRVFGVIGGALGLLALVACFAAIVVDACLSATRDPGFCGMRQAPPWWVRLLGRLPMFTVIYIYGERVRKERGKLRLVCDRWDRNFLLDRDVVWRFKSFKACQDHVRYELLGGQYCSLRIGVDGMAIAAVACMIAVLALVLHPTVREAALDVASKLEHYSIQHWREHRMTLGVSVWGACLTVVVAFTVAHVLTFKVAAIAAFKYAIMWLPVMIRSYFQPVGGQASVAALRQSLMSFVAIMCLLCIVLNMGACFSCPRYLQTQTRSLALTVWRRLRQQ